MNQNIRPPYTSLNKYFLIPFLLWVISGGISLVFFDKQLLFATVNTHHTPTLDKAMFYVTKLGEGVFSVIILLLLMAQDSFRNWWYFSAAFLANVFPALLAYWVKIAVDAPRPLKYFHEASWIHIARDWPSLFEHSFPSGHTCAAFSLFGFLSLILVPRFKWAGLVFFAAALSVAYSRLYLAAHFFADVYAGSIIGFVFSILVVWLMNKYPHYFYKRKPPDKT